MRLVEPDLDYVCPICGHYKRGIYWILDYAIEWKYVDNIKIVNEFQRPTCMSRCVPEIKTLNISGMDIVNFNKQRFQVNSMNTA